MTRELELRHEILCTPAQFWEWVHFGGFNEAMYADHFGYGFDVLEDEVDLGTRKTRVRPVVPHAPKALVKLFGDSLSFEEHGALERSDPWIYRFKVQPGAFPTKIAISGQLVVTPAEDPARCIREVDFTIGCTIFGVGGLFERFVAAEISRSYDESADYTNVFLRERGLIPA